MHFHSVKVSMGLSLLVFNFLNALNISTLKRRSINDDIETLANIILQEYFPSSQCIVVISEKGALRNVLMWNARIDLELDSTKEDCNITLHHFLKETFKLHCDGYIVQLKQPECALEGWHDTNRRKFIPRHNPQFFFLPIEPTGRSPADQLMSLPISDISQYILAGELQKNHSGDWKVILWTNNFYQHPRESGREAKIYLDEWQPLTGFMKKANLYPDKIKDLRGKNFRIATGKYLPYAIDNPLDGMENRIACQFCRLHNCTPVPVTDDSSWGSIYDNFTGIGVLGNVYADLADVGCFAIYTWLDEHYYIDYSDSYLRAEVTVMTPRPGRIGGWVTQFLPFKADMWLAIFLSLTLSAFSLLFVTKASIKLTRFGEKLSRKKQFTSLGDSWMRAVGLVVLQQPSSRFIGDSPSRYLFTSFEFLYLVLAAMYSAELASFLTVPMYEAPIDRFSQFAASELPWYGTHLAWVYWLREGTDSDTISILRHFQVRPSKELGTAAKEGKFGLAVERLPGGSMTEQPHITADVIPMYHIMKENLYVAPLVASIKKGGPYNKYYNIVVNKVVEHGLSLYWEAESVRHYMDSRIQSGYRVAKTMHEDSVPQVIQLENIIGAVYLFCIGSLLSVVAFIIEKLRSSKSEPRGLLFTMNSH